MRPVLVDAALYDAATVEKVERLLELLSEFARDPFLQPRLVLHGGTALNLFHGPMPRLSVDIDLLYAGSPEREVMLAERPLVEDGIRRIAKALGYQVGDVKPDVDAHAGRTFKLAYKGGRSGPGKIKIDAIFVDRVPLMGSVSRWVERADPSVSFRCVQPGELVARKVKALVERKRPAVRDVFDVAWWGRLDGLDGPLFRALVTYFFSLSEPFPTRFRQLDSGVLSRFDDLESVVRTDLLPVLPSGHEMDTDAILGRVGRLLDEWGHTTADQDEYLRRLDEEVLFSPELLFRDWPEVLDRARLDPVMTRKCDNLRGRAT